MKTVSLLVLAILLLLCDAQEFYVTPTWPSDACPPGKLCHSLSYYATNSNSIFDGKRNVTLFLLNGTHTLSPEEHVGLEIINVYCLAITGIGALRGSIGDGSNPQTIIKVSYISVRNVHLLTIHNCKLVIDLLEVSDVRLIVYNQLAFNNTFLISYTRTDSVEILNTHLFSSNFAFFQTMAFQFVKCSFKSSRVRVFAENSYTQQHMPKLKLLDSVIHGSSLLISLSKGALAVILQNTTFSGRNSGVISFIQPIDIEHKENFMDLQVIKCTFLSDSIGIQLIISGGNVKMTTCHCEFSRNQRGLIATINKGSVSALVSDTNFTHSFEFPMFFHTLKPLGIKHLTLRNVHFLHNTVEAPGALIISGPGPINMTIEDCTFAENLGLTSTLFLRSVNVQFLGYTEFINNVGSTGGAIYMSRSTLWLDSRTYISFVNNTVDNVGGAIYIEEAGQESFFDVVFNAGSSAQCFYQLSRSMNSTADSVLPTLHFEHNTAPAGGDSIYGASLASSCRVMPGTQVSSNQIQERILEFQTESLSTVSSSPKRVCLCDNGVPKCDNINFIFWNETVRPGEKFNLSLVLVGDDFGTVTGEIYASKADGFDTEFLFGDGQTVQRITDNKNCSSLEYSIHSEKEKAAFYLSRDGFTATSLRALRSFLPLSEDFIIDAADLYQTQGIINLNLQFVQITVTVNLLPCPLGFELNTNNLVCHCGMFLSKFAQRCYVSNGRALIHRNGTIWISTISTETNSSDTILAHTLCPFGYCKLGNIPITFDEPDMQCAFNHSGILCGGCLPDLSLAIGTSQCIHCFNDGHRALVLIFALAGVVLVFFLKIFDLTVAHGTINALIFYANVIWINQSIFFPSEHDHNDYRIIQLLQVMKVFIAWLNLDFGIETCFINGLDAYWKTWLQFVFPLYLWILAALIILACHYSTRITKLFGNNSVSVLATIFLLSYVKLLRTIVTVLGFAILQQHNLEQTRWVWLEDGNIPYLGLRHSILFTTALIVLFILWLPFTALLLFGPLLKKTTNVKIAGWINKFKPLFDSYFGPLNDKHQYWVGLTLLTRVILAITAAAIQANHPIVNIDLAIIASVLIFVLLNKIYKKKFVFFLEFSFLINIAILGIIYLSTTDVTTRIVSTFVSTSISFMLFMVILAFHLLTSLKSVSCKQNRPSAQNTTISVSNNVELAANNKDTETIEDDPSSFVTRTTIELRECILES